MAEQLIEEIPVELPDPMIKVSAMRYIDARMVSTIDSEYYTLQGDSIKYTYSVGYSQLREKITEIKLAWGKHGYIN